MITNIKNTSHLKITIKKLHPLVWMLIVSIPLLFFCSSLRHILFQSNALDLGWFDQAVYLISQGKSPIVSFAGFHILGDHAAFIFYPIALLYKIFPSVYWLLGIQSIALSIAIIPLWYLALKAGLKEKQATTLAIVYLLYPLIFNINLFDFHAEVIALPAIFWAILAASLNNIGGFCLAIVIILSCKAILSLTVAAMGVWLLISAKKRKYGSIAIVVGIAWFLISTEVIIPTFTGADAAAEMADARYSYLGNSVVEIAKNIILKPGLVLGKLFSSNNFEYIILVLVPIIWGLSPRYLTPLMGAIPALGLNLITDYSPQKSLTTQYSLPILPFLFLAVIATLVAGEGWFKRSKWMIVWSLICFIALAKYGYFGSLYLESLDTWKANREALALVKTQGGVLTTASIAPHLTHRPLIKLAIDGSQSLDLKQFEYILLNQRHPGWASSTELIDDTIQKIEKFSDFQLIYAQDGVFLFSQSYPKLN